MAVQTQEVAKVVVAVVAVVAAVEAVLAVMVVGRTENRYRKLHPPRQNPRKRVHRLERKGNELWNLMVATMLVYGA